MGCPLMNLKGATDATTERTQARKLVKGVQAETDTTTFIGVMKGVMKRMEKIYKVQVNKQGAPNFATAEEVTYKYVKYFDPEEGVWKIGEVIIDE